MKNILVLMSIFAITACGGGKETTSEDGTAAPKEKTSKLLSRTLKNTSWAMPSYPVAGISILDGQASVSMSESSFLSNGNIVVLEDDPADDFVVFNVYTTNDNRVFGLKMVDKDTIEISIITGSNSLEGYKEYHNNMKTEMKKQS